jgi:tetratricopeptide (TPR) repeat protein
VKNGYDVRRSKTDEIINSIDKNVGTILFGESYSGKSTILGRVILEEVVENGYAVVHGEGMKAEASLLRGLLENITSRFTRVLVIADNVHKRGSEELFKVFNKYYNVKNDTDTDNRIRFLFAARKTEFDIFKNTLEPNDKKEINHSLSHMEKIRLSFEEQDAILFLRKALSVSNREKNISEEEIEREAKRRYESSKHDLFMFIYAVQEYIGGDKIYVHFFEDDMEQKINSISENIVLERPSLLCSFMGMCGIELSNELMDNCGIYFDIRNLLVRKGFLFQNGKYRVRHERWSKEFLFYLYKMYFSNNFKPFDDKYKIREILQSILNNVNVEDLFNILNVSSSLFEEKEGRLKPLGEVVIQNFTVPDHLNVNDKADLYCYGLGTFYHLLGDYKKAIDAYDKAIEIKPDHAGAWYNKGLSLARLGRYEEAIISYDKATKIKPDYADAWYNRACSNVAKNEIEKALSDLEKAIEIDKDTYIKLAKEDADFEGIRNNERFKKLIKNAVDSYE